GGQDAVEDGRAAAALDVAENDRPGLDADPLLDLFGDELPDAALAQDHVAERVDGDILCVRGRDVDSLGGDDQAPLTTSLPLADQVAAHLVQVERYLGQQDPIRARADAAVERHPARVPAHHLQHQDAAMALGSIPQPI